MIKINKRAAGLLLHITSLPSKYGIGDLGPEAYKFADFLVKAKQRYWQILPLTPPAKPVNSPYNCLSAFAGNTLLISPDLLYEKGFLYKKDFNKIPEFEADPVNYSKVDEYKNKLFDAAFERFKNKKINPSFKFFCKENDDWLDDYAIFIVLHRHFDSHVWSHWPAKLRDRHKLALESVKKEFAYAIEKEKFLQYLFFKQWYALKSYCNKNHVRIIGDIPFYVAYDSADVWTHPELFKLTKTKKPEFISGVPPDYFSSTGQLWGNPVYKWDVLKRKRYSWWISRMKQNFALCDVVRIDHFRGFAAYWQVRADQKTAIKGKWVKTPGEDFFKELSKYFPTLPILAEDLGYITEDVKELIKKFDFPSMKVLLFAFGGNPAKNTHYPHNHVKNSVVYTGTHDNNTIVGWFKNEANNAQKNSLYKYIGRRVSVSQVHWELIRMAMSSVCNLAIIPVQDLLGLGKQARMNRPAVSEGNWKWRLKQASLTAAIAEKLAKLAEIFARD